MSEEKRSPRRMMTPGPHVTDEMVAMSVRGYTMGAIRDGWIVFFNNHRTVPHDGHIDELCVVETDTGRVLLRFLKKGRKTGTWDLVSVTGEPMLDVDLKWAERIEWIRPHKITPEEMQLLGGTRGFREFIE